MYTLIPMLICTCASERARAHKHTRTPAQIWLALQAKSKANPRETCANRGEGCLEELIQSLFSCLWIQCVYPYLKISSEDFRALLDCVWTGCQRDNSHGFFCTAVALSKNIKVRAHGGTEVFFIFSVSCNKSVYLCMNVQGDPRTRKEEKTQAENVWRRQLLLSSRMNTTFAKLFLT